MQNPTCPGCGRAVESDGVTCEDCTAYGTVPKFGLAATTTPTPPKKSRSYTKRVEIGGKCVMVTLHDDRVELREKYGRKRAEFLLERIWDAAEGRLC